MLRVRFEIWLRKWAFFVIKLDRPFYKVRFPSEILNPLNRNTHISIFISMWYSPI